MTQSKNESLKEEIERKFNMKNVPTIVHFELTYRCNLDCIHCFIASRESINELSLQEIESLLPQLRDLGVFHIVLTGGEPMVRDNWLDIASSIKNGGFMITIYTNATLVTQSIADDIAGLRPAAIEVSLYGSNQRSYESVTRVKGSFEKCIRGIELLCERGVNVKLKPIILKQNIDDYKEMMALKLVHPKLVFDPTIFPKMDGSLAPVSCRLSNEELFKLYYRIGFKPAADKKMSLCSIGKSGFVINPFGQVNPCICLPISAGNARTQPLAVIWHSSPIFKRLRSLSADDFPKCNSCDLIEYCSPCLVLNFLENSDLLLPSVESCRIAKIRKDVVDRKMNIKGVIT